MEAAKNGDRLRMLLVAACTLLVAAGAAYLIVPVGADDLSKAIPRLRALEGKAHWGCGVSSTYSASVTSFYRDVKPDAKLARAIHAELTDKGFSSQRYPWGTSYRKPYSGGLCPVVSYVTVRPGRGVSAGASRKKWPIGTGSWP